MDSATDPGFDTVECGDETGLDMSSDDLSSNKSQVSLYSIMSAPPKDKDQWNKTHVYESNLHRE